MEEICPQYIHVGEFVIFSPDLNSQKSNITIFFGIFFHITNWDLLEEF